MLAFLRWFVPSVVPALLLLVLIRQSDEEREPPFVVAGTYLLGLAGGAVAFLVEDRAAAWSGFDVRASVAGEGSSLLFVLAFVAPVREACKVAACWPVFRSRYFDEPYDGLVYGAAAALGFASFENAHMLRTAAGPFALAVGRAALALPAHLFFAALWGHALGRAKTTKETGPVFPIAWLGASFAQGMFIHFLYGRGPGALVATVPLLLTMGGVTWLGAADLRRRSRRPAQDLWGSRLSAPSVPPRGGLLRGPQPPSLSAVREALRHSDRPLALRWILFGALVTLGAILLGFVVALAAGHGARVDFARVDEHDVATTGPVFVLGAGVLGAFPVSGYVIARASGLTSLLEPALATCLALLLLLLLLGLAAPLAVVFALAFSPIAFGLACAGAWLGRPAFPRTNG